MAADLYDPLSGPWAGAASRSRLPTSICLGGTKPPSGIRPAAAGVDEPGLLVREGTRGRRLRRSSLQAEARACRRRLRRSSKRGFNALGFRPSIRARIEIRSAFERCWRRPNGRRTSFGRSIGRSPLPSPPRARSSRWSAVPGRAQENPFEAPIAHRGRCTVSSASRPEKPPRFFDPDGGRRSRRREPRPYARPPFLWVGGRRIADERVRRRGAARALPKGSLPRVHGQPRTIRCFHGRRPAGGVKVMWRSHAARRVCVAAALSSGAAKAALIRSARFEPFSSGGGDRGCRTRVELASRGGARAGSATALEESAAIAATITRQRSRTHESIGSMEARPSRSL